MTSLPNNDTKMSLEPSADDVEPLTITKYLGAKDTEQFCDFEIYARKDKTTFIFKCHKVYLIQGSHFKTYFAEYKDAKSYPPSAADADLDPETTSLMLQLVYWSIEPHFDNLRHEISTKIRRHFPSGVPNRSFTQAQYESSMYMLLKFGFDGLRLLLGEMWFWESVPKITTPNEILTCIEFADKYKINNDLQIDLVHRLYQLRRQADPHDFLLDLTEVDHKDHLKPKSLIPILRAIVIVHEARDSHMDAFLSAGGDDKDDDEEDDAPKITLADYKTRLNAKFEFPLGCDG